MKKCLLMCVLFAAVFLHGCAKETSSQNLEESDKKDAIQIGVTFDSFVIERWQRDRDIFVSAAQELGAEVNIQNANGDLQEQIAQIDYFIQKDMDAIVVIGIDADGLSEVVERARIAGIPVIAYDRLIHNANVSLYISFDNYAVGSLMAEHMQQHLEDTGEILQVCGPLSDNNVTLVMDGFQTALEDSSLQIVHTEFAEGWLAETGFTVVNEYLSIHENIDGIMCGNDSIAGQAIRSLSEQRLAGKVCVVGQDADLDACQRIVEGTQCMTVYKPVEKLAKKAAEKAVQLAKGESIMARETINDGKYDVPYECLEPIAVTKENMDEIITGKYHEESDIYLNVKK